MLNLPRDLSPLCLFVECVCVCVYVCMRTRVRSVVSNSSGPMDYRPPGSSIYGISQARTLESGLPLAALGDLPDPEIEPVSPPLAGRFFTTEPPGKPSYGELSANWLNLSTKPFSKLYQES